MSLRFSGGYPIQRGRGIGGLLRTVASFFKPIIKTIGKTAVKAVKSDAGKMIGKTLKEQAVSSALNLTADALRGNDLKESLRHEVASSKETLGNVVEGVRNNVLKREHSEEEIPKLKPKRQKIHKKIKKKNYIW